MRDIWGIHDFVPDYRRFTCQEDFARAALNPKSVEGGPSGCGFYRIVSPLDALKAQGWDAGYAFGDPPADLAKIIVAQRMDKHDALPYWRRWKAGHRLVYEIDDDVFKVDITNWMAHGTYGKLDVRDAVGHAAEVADIVTVTTEPLAEVMREFNREVRVLPNVIPDGVLDIERTRQAKVVVGWAGGASHARDLALVAGSLRHVIDRHGKRAELHLMGTNYAETVGRPARFTPWIPIDASLDYFRAIDFDIALAPLSGTKFDMSKSNLKALEAFGLGIPVLASDVEPYRGTVIDGVNGYLCRKKSDWGRRLDELINDEAARTEMGRNAREMARAHTMSEGWKLWASAYQELM